MAIISGGQTGVDRAALLFAEKTGRDYKGWVPLGGLAEDLPVSPGIRSVYPKLLETETRDYKVRTERNVKDASRVLILVRDKNLTGGTLLTWRLAREYNKPCLVLTLDQGSEPARRFIEAEGDTLIAGPRESGEPGIEEEALLFLLDGK